MVQRVEVRVEELPDVETLEGAAFFKPRVDHAVTPVEVELAPVRHEEQMPDRPGRCCPEVVVVRELARGPEVHEGALKHGRLDPAQGGEEDLALQVARRRREHPDVCAVLLILVVFVELLAAGEDALLHDALRVRTRVGEPVPRVAEHDLAHKVVRDDGEHPVEGPHLGFLLPARREEQCVAQQCRQKVGLVPPVAANGIVPGLIPPESPGRTRGGGRALLQTARQGTVAGGSAAVSELMC